MTSLIQPVFGLETHNGTITVSNPATGQHRTFRVRTQKEDAWFAPGSRIVGMLTGPNNERDYTGFGFVQPDGKIKVWAKHRGTQMDRYAQMLERPQHESEKFGLVFDWSAKCRRCNRELTTPESLIRGLGEICQAATNR